MIDCNAVATPLDLSQKLTVEICPQSEEAKREMENVLYMEAIGSLLYKIFGPISDSQIQIAQPFFTKPRQSSLARSEACDAVFEGHSLHRYRISEIGSEFIWLLRC